MTAAWDPLVGLPFDKEGHGDGLEPGPCHCYGLFRLASRVLLGVEVPRHEGRFGTRQERREVEALMRGEGDRYWLRVVDAQWHQTGLGKPQFGDLVLCRSYESAIHVGFYLGKVEGRRSMLHTDVGHDSCVVDVEGPEVRDRFLGVYRYAP